MSSSARVNFGLIFALIFSLLVPLADAAERQKTRRTPAISEVVYKKLAEVQEYIDGKAYDQAIRAITDVERRIDRYNGYEKAQIYNMAAFAWYSKEDYTKATEYYRKILDQGKDIPLAMELQTTYSLAQLYFVNEQYQTAIDYMQKWFLIAENPGPRPYIFIAQAYYSMQQYQKGIGPVEKAMAIATSRETPIKEQWWLLLRVLYYELENWPKVLEILEVLVRDFPKREYWVQLSGVYGQQGFEDKQLAALQVAYYQGYLRERGLLNLAGLLMQSEVPYQASQVLKYGLDSELIEATEQNVQQLAQAYHLAQEVDLAIPMYEQAGDLSPDGRILHRLATLYLGTEKYKKCIAAIDRSVDKGGLRNSADAFIVKGMCQFNIEKLNGGRRSFVEARRRARKNKEKTTLQSAENWITYVDRELDRREQLRLAAGS